MKCMYVVIGVFCFLLAQPIFAKTKNFITIPATNAVVLNFDSNITPEVRSAISNDFNICYNLSAKRVKFVHYNYYPTNHFGMVGLWKPYSAFNFMSKLGPSLPSQSILTNGSFVIDISYAFATNYQRHIESTMAYSNEIALAYTFIESISPANLAKMSVKNLKALDLWKEVPPGKLPSYFDAEEAIEYLKNRHIVAPPRMSFYLWQCGPKGNSTYLWCVLPEFQGDTNVSANLMIFYQNRWWLSSWPLQEGEQQW